MQQSDHTSVPDAPLIERWPLLHPVTWVFATLPFQWMPGAGGVTVPYLFVMLAMGALCLAPRAIIGMTWVLRCAAIWLVPYLVYLMILFVSLSASGEQGMATRQAFFLAAFVTVAAWLATAQTPARLLRWWAGGMILSFLLVSETIARSLGLSWVDAYTRFYINGDLGFIVYGFLREIFIASAGASDAFVPASQKNMVSGALFLALLMFRAGYMRSDRDTTGLIVTVLLVSLLIMLNTRIVLVSLVLGGVVVWLIRFSSGQNFSLGGLLLRVFVVLFAGLALLAFLGSDSAIASTLSERFLFEDHSTGSRLSQYAWALQQIEQSFFTGSGYGELSGQPVHNIFLGAFMHAGVFAFLLVLFFYGVTLAIWAGFVLRLVREPQDWVLPLRGEWVAVLPMLPLLRMWVSGDAGHHSIVEWAAMAVFIGLLASNEALRPALERGRASRRTASGTRPDRPVEASDDVLYPQKIQ